MTKTKTNSPSLDEINAQIAALGNEVDTGALGEAVKQRQMAMLETIALSEDPVERAAQFAPLTPALVEDRVDTAMVNLFDTFFHAEQRIEGTNGKKYPIDYDFTRSHGAGTDPVEPTDNIVVVDKYGYLNKQLARALCSGLEMVQRNQQQAIERQKAKIVSEIRFGRNAGVDVIGKVENMARFLEDMVEQAAFVTVAQNRAAETYNQLTGDTYETREEREAGADARKSQVTQGDLGDRLAKLGIS